MSYRVYVESTLKDDWLSVVDVVAHGCYVAVRDATTVGAAQARVAHRYHNRTGQLRDSTRGRVEAVGELGAHGVLEATAKHASYIERGTRAHPIEPRRAQALRWEDGEGVHYARHVNHPGTQPMPFLAPTIPLMDRTMTRVLEHAVTAAQAKLP